MARAQTPATTATTMMMTVCVLVPIWMLPRSERTSSRVKPDGEEGGGGATLIGTATFSTTVMVGASVTVTARAAESAAAG